VGDSIGALYHFDGTGFAAGFSDPSNMGISSLYESPSGKVYLASSALFTCAGDCTVASNFTTPSNYQSLGCQVVAVCGSGEVVYGVGSAGAGTSSGPTGCLLTTDGQGNWSELSLPDIPSGAAACAVQPDGVASIVGPGTIMTYSPSQGASLDTINWPANTGTNSAYVSFQAAWTDGINRFAAGGNCRVFGWTASGWNPVLNNSPIDPNTDGAGNASFAALAGAGGQAWALGNSQATYQAAYFDGTAWSYAPDIASGDAIIAAWAADASHYYAVGTPDGISPLLMVGSP
jgi:hypothetical protein